MATIKVKSVGNGVHLGNTPWGNLTALRYVVKTNAAGAVINSDSTASWPTRREKTPAIADNSSAANRLVRPRRPATVTYARYGYRMAAEATEVGRISAFVRWVARTPWPVFTLGMLQADIIGALFVLGLGYVLRNRERDRAAEAGHGA